MMATAILAINALPPRFWDDFICSFSPSISLSCPLCRRPRRRLDVPAGECQERRPVWARGVSTAMLAEGHITINQRCLYPGKPRSSQILLSQELVHRPSANPAQDHSLTVHPPIPLPATPAQPTSQPAHPTPLSHSPALITPF